MGGGQDAAEQEGASASSEWAKLHAAPRAHVEGGREARADAAVGEHLDPVALAALLVPVLDQLLLRRAHLGDAAAAEEDYTEIFAMKAFGGSLAADAVASRRTR